MTEDSPQSGRVQVPEHIAPVGADALSLQPAVLDQMRDAIMVTDLAGTVTACNRAVEDIYGYAPEELIGQNVSLLYPAAESAYLEEIVVPTVISQGRFRGELRNRTRSGDYTHVHLSVSLIRDEHGSPVGMIGITINLTLQKLDELSRPAEQQPQPTDGSSPDASPGPISLPEALRIAELGTWEFDCVTGRVTWSEQIYRLFDIDPRLPAPSFSAQRNYFTPDSMDRLESAVHRAIEHLTPYELDLEFCLPDGSTRWAISRGIIQESKEGRATRLCGTFQNITERKRSEQMLREAEERATQNERQFRDLAETLPQFIWTADAEGHKTYCNQRYLEYTGITSAEEMDRLWTVHIHPEDRSTTVAAWDYALATGIPYVSEYRLRSRSGTYRRFLARGIAVRDSEGNVRQWLGSITDIHEQKQAEEALRQAEKLTVAATLASSISHEINNPLEGLINLIYLLSLNSTIDGLARDYLKLAEDQLLRVSRITSQALRFHRQATAATPVNISGLVDSLLQQLNPLLQARAIEVRRRYRPVEPLSCFDADLRHAISSILSNAADAVGHNGILCVRVHRTSGVVQRSADGVRITIADNGAGIAPDVLPRIFEPFFSTKGERGTGLGLWIAKGIIERHKGRITVRSSTQKGRSGTTVSVFLPYNATLSA